MASSKNIVITLKGQVIYKNESNKTKAQEKLADTTNIQATGDMDGGYSESPLGEMVSNIRSVTKTTTAGAFAIQIGKTLLSNGDQWLQRSLQATDQYRFQRTITEAKTVASWMTSSGSKIIAGAMAGGSVGAVLATIDVAVETGLNIWQNQENQRLQINKQETEMDMSRVRFGYSLNSGSIGGDK